MCGRSWRPRRNAKFQSATKQLDEIWSQFEHSQRFTDAMKVELVQARRDINRLHHQSGHLTSRKIGSENDAKTAASDINLFFLSKSHGHPRRRAPSISDAPRRSRVHGAAASGATCEVRADQPQAQDAARRRSDQGLPQRTAARIVQGPLLRSWKSITAVVRRGTARQMRKVETIREDFRPIRERIERWISASDSATGSAYEQSIVVYRDLDGERALHAQHTQDLRLQRVGT